MCQVFLRKQNNHESAPLITQLVRFNHARMFYSFKEPSREKLICHTLYTSKRYVV